MKNVYMFNASCHGSVYGVGTYIKQTAKALKDSGINITIVLLESGQDILRVTEEDGLKTIHLPMSATPF